MTELPEHLKAKGFVLVAKGIARKDGVSTAFGTRQRYTWLVRIPSGWALASSEAHAKQLRKINER